MIADARPPGYPQQTRQCLRHDGLHKRRWPTRRMAQRYARHIGIPSTQYLCPECLRWHNATRGEER